MIDEKRLNMLLLAVAGSFGMSLWFSASAALPQLTVEWDLSEAGQSWITMSVQIGFVTGALISALLNLGDRISSARLLGYSAFGGALCNALIPLLNVGIGTAMILRFLTGACLAGVYPPAMKLMASWCKQDRGLGIGILIGAISLGKAFPHLLNAFPIFGDAGMPSWRSVLLASSFSSLIASLVGFFLLTEGPFLAQAARFDWRLAGMSLRNKPSRLANFGYLGHMWELYAMWTWVPIFLLASYEHAGWSLSSGRVAGFAAIAAGAAGCYMAGLLADRMGRTRITIASLLISGSCCLLAGFFFSSPTIVTLICIVWGFAVVADSAQFSAAVTELSDPRYVGTALTVQTCLGFLLTLLTIRLVPSLLSISSWKTAFAFLAIGPVFGIVSMYKLRTLPEAEQMASGKR